MAEQPGLGGGTGTGYPPTGASYTVTWHNATFTEVTNPLARFQEYRLKDPDGDLIAELPPLSKPFVANRPIDDLSDVTDADITEAMAKLGLTKQLLHDAMNEALGEAESAATDLENALIALDGDDFANASKHLRTWLRVTLACGTSDPYLYEWVAIVPVPIDCNGTDATEELVVVVDVNDVSFDDVIVEGEGGTPQIQNDVPDTADLTMRVLLNLDPLVVAPSNAFVVGFSFRENGVGITTRLDQLDSIRLVVSGLARAAEADEGTVTFDSVSTFNSGSRYHVTHGKKVSRAFSVSPALEGSPTGFAVDYVISTPSDRQEITLKPATASLARDAYLHVDNGAGNVLVAEYWAPALPFTIVRSSAATPEAGTKHTLSIGAVDGEARPFSEVKGTVWDQAGMRTVFYIVGLPATANLILDHGTGPDAAASLDFARQGAYLEWFRTIALEARTPFLPWNQTIKDAGRSYIAVAEENPTNDEDVPFVYQALHYETHLTGSSTAKGDGGIVGVYEAATDGIELTDDGGELTDWLLAEPVECTTVCEGALARGEEVRAHPSAHVNYTFASLPQGSYQSCALEHEGTRTCV